MPALNLTLPYERISPLHIPRRDLSLAVSDSLSVRMTIVQGDYPTAQALELTGGIGGPAIAMLVYRDSGRRPSWHDYAAPYSPVGEVLWSGVGVATSTVPGTFDVLIPAGELAGCPPRCGWAIRLDWADGGHSELLMQGSVHIAPSALTLMRPIPLVTDDGAGIEILGA